MLRFNQFKKINESSNIIAKASESYVKTLDKDMLKALLHQKEMAHTSLYEGDLYTKEQFEDFVNFTDTIDKIHELIDDMDISDFYYDNFSDEIFETLPEDGEEVYSVDKDDFLSEFLGDVATYL